jgi:hypothetical protein
MISCDTDEVNVLGRLRFGWPLATSAGELLPRGRRERSREAELVK